MQIPDALVRELLANPELRKPDTRTVIFLLQNPVALSNNELAAGIGVSQKSANKSVKRLISAGLIQPGEPQAKRRTFIIHLLEPKEPVAVTEGNKDASIGAFTERLDRIESMIGALLARPVTASAPDGQNETGKVSLLSCIKNSEPINGQKGTGIVPVCSHDRINVTAPAPEGIEAGHKVTGVMPIFSQVDEQKNMQDKMNTEQGTNGTTQGTTGTKHAVKGRVNDPIAAKLDDAITRADARLAALAFNKEKAAAVCAPASIGEVFHSLFGVNVPVGSDPAAVGVMIARKKTGKLDNVKSPLAYLSALAGKVQPIVAIPTPPPANSNLPSVNEPRLAHETMTRINTMWENISDEQRKPFEVTARTKFENQTGRFKVPVELLARAAFNTEQLRNHTGKDHHFDI